MPSSHHFVRAALLALLMLAATPALAQTCSLSTVGVGFGNYDTLSSMAVQSNGFVLISCRNNTPNSRTFNYNVRLSQGTSGVFVPTRQAASGGNRLAYQLFTSAAFSSVWGDGTAGTSTVSGSLVVPGRSTRLRLVTVFGRMPGAQDVPAGVYGDSIQVTVTY